MSTSDWEGLVQYAPTNRAATAPVGAHHARQLINNVSHLADEAGQVRVAWSAINGQYLEATSTVLNDFQLVGHFGPFPLSVRADGSAYPLRTRVAGFSNTGDSVNFYVTVAPFNDKTALGESGNTAAQIITSATSMTNQWLADELLQVSAERVAEATVLIDTLDGVAGSVEQTEVALMTARVFTVSGAAERRGRLTALYMAEYIGL